MRRILALFLLLAAHSPGASPVDFNRDVRPIISEKCYHCHGPDEEARRADLRLDLRDDAIKERDGVRAIIPGKPDQSELMIRVRSKDPDEVMPPPKEQHHMSEAECNILQRWIAEGAVYAQHWAFTKPASKEGQHIDGFIAAELKKHGLTMSPEADKPTLIRRLSLDLIGLPPTLDETRTFIEDTAPDAYSRAVDRLLASPHFGERWARMWLDLARYADSSGYGSDFVRLNIWPWRDWVIRAFNRNMPYDQFTIDQLAGDLLPNPTRDQLVATGFHRNTMTNFEGGTPDEEYRVAAVKDRVATTLQVWMGLTAGCAQCHSHKFDPISMREYYQLFAIFNQTEDADRNDEEPKMALPTPEEERQVAMLKARIANLDSRLGTVTPDLEAEFSTWLAEPERKVEWVPLATAPQQPGVFVAKTSLRNVTALRVELPEGESLYELRVNAQPVAPTPRLARYVRVEHGPGKLLQIAEVQVFSQGKNIARDGKARQSSTYAEAVASRAIDGKTEAAYNKGSVAHTGDGDKAPYWEVDLGRGAAIERVVFWNRAEEPDRIEGARLMVLDERRKPLLTRILDERPMSTFDALGGVDAILTTPSANAGDPEGAIDGKAETRWTGNTAVFEMKPPLDVGGESSLTINVAGPENLRFAITTTAAPVREMPKVIRELRAMTTRTPQQHAELLSYFRPLSKHDIEAKAELERVKAQLAALKPLQFPIMRELPKERQRDTKILIKGNYLMPGDPVTASLPAGFHPAPDGAINRLALAKWIVSRENPLTARVAVNRFWAQLFGTGLVESEEDFGTQGSLPSHPELLDWLALEFQRDWDVKRILKVIVMSSTYRQSAKMTSEATAKDARNRLLSHYPRRRVGAEELRDQALMTSGLLSRKVGGPSVFPPQPAGLWNVAFNGGQNTYKTSTGEDRYRRGIYTFWRRTMPNPTMATFDAPSRETCALRRIPTNTPLQAFVTLNDPVFVECAQALARRILREGGNDIDSRIRYGLVLALGRPAEDAQVATLRKLLEAELVKFRQVPADAVVLATNPLGALPADMEPVEAAAWTAVANVLLNLDAFLTRS